MLMVSLVNLSVVDLPPARLKFPTSKLIESKKNIEYELLAMLIR